MGRPRRTWPGVPLGLMTAEDALSGAGDASGAGAEGDVEGEAVAATAVDSTEAVESYLTEAHRAVIQCRDETHASCVSQVRCTLAVAIELAPHLASARLALRTCAVLTALSLASFHSLLLAVSLAVQSERCRDSRRVRCAPRDGGAVGAQLGAACGALTGRLGSS